MDNHAATRSRHPRRYTGFTLIEIMAVVLIMGLLVGIVGYNVFSQVDAARIQTTRAKMSQLESALEFYRMNHSQYPTSEQGLDALIRSPTAPPEPKNYPPEGYLRKASALLDGWNTRFEYDSPGANSRHTFDLWSLGPDRAPGGNDDVVSWDDDSFAEN
ncbi:MAG: type II secretion system major pseudopilin GspG [Proteobacteria bacterium]|nr:type II secretion system major pseudopilin GspG [Pseudomonadota bacterium]